MYMDDAILMSLIVIGGTVAVLGGVAYFVITDNKKHHKD